MKKVFPVLLVLALALSACAGWTNVPSAPANTAAPAAPVDTGETIPACMSWADFKSLANGQGVYELIDLLDSQPTKRDHPKSEGSWQVSDVSVIWTGLYVDDVTVGGKVSSVATDGKTGVWLARGPVTIPTAGGEICVTGFDGSMPLTAGVTDRNGGTITASGCVDQATVVKIINDNKQSDPNKIYRLLDQLVDQNTDARLRFGGNATVDVKNASTLLWALDASANGPVLALDTTESKTLWLATADGKVNMTHAFSGVQVCSPINPARDFPWWGQ